MDAQAPKRKGTALWFPDSEADLLRAVAAAEDRPIQRVMARALKMYADASPEYQAVAPPPEAAP